MMMAPHMKRMTKNNEENDDHNDDDDDDDGGSILGIPPAFESDPDHQSALRKSYSDSGLVPAILIRSVSGSTAGMTTTLSQNSLLSTDLKQLQGNSAVESGSPGSRNQTYAKVATRVEESEQSMPPFAYLDGQRSRDCSVVGPIEGTTIDLVKNMMSSLSPQELCVRHQDLLALCAKLSGLLACRATSSVVLEETENGDVSTTSVVDALDVSICVPQPLLISHVKVPSTQTLPVFAMPSMNEKPSDHPCAGSSFVTKINLTFVLRELLDVVVESKNCSYFSRLVKETIEICNEMNVRIDDSCPAMCLLLLCGLSSRPVQHIPCLEAHLQASQRCVGLPRYNSAGRALGRSARTPSAKDKYKSDHTVSSRLEANDEPLLMFLGKGGFATIHAGYCAVSGPARQSCLESSKALCESGCFAIKRQRREHRCVDLLPALVDIFAEVSCLKRLTQAQCTGVCRIYGYGVMESDGAIDGARRSMLEESNGLRNPSEYVLVLELGGPSVSDWRNQLTSTHVVKALTSLVHAQEVQEEPPRSSLDMMLCLFLLELYWDMALVVAQIHQTAVLHFDIKASNFLFADISRLLQLTSTSQTQRSRGEWEGDKDLIGLLLQLWPMMRHKHQQGKPSGVVLLCDFGEGLCLHPVRAESGSRSELCPPSLNRCRGTLPIQAPEFVALTSAKKSNENNLYDEPALNSHRSLLFTTAGPDVGAGSHSNFASARGPETGRSANSTTSSLTLGSTHPPYHSSGVTAAADGGRKDVPYLFRSHTQATLLMSGRLDVC